MSLRRLTPRPNTFFRSHNVPRPRHLTTPPPTSTTTTSPTKQASRLQNVIARLPRPLQRYATPLLNAPATHITSFLILHEITAIVPLLGLSALFHYTNWLPQSWTEGKYVREGVERFGKWFGKKGWFGFTPATGTMSGNEVVEGVDTHGEVADGGKGEMDMRGLEEEVEKRWGVKESGGRILVEVATAYAITKVFLPARILASVWGTPWFARAVLGRLTGLFGRKGADTITKSAR